MFENYPSFEQSYYSVYSQLFTQASLSMSKICLIFHSMSQLASVALLTSGKIEKNMKEPNMSHYLH